MAKHFKHKSGTDLYYLKASGHHPANTYFHFSFANYYDPNNMGFGALRVLNEDDVKPHSGFDKHPHRDMEIVSYVVSGELTHWDSVTEVKEVLKRGCVQTVTAGKGIWHAELNESDKWTRFLQIWIMPPVRNLPVRYEYKNFTLKDRENKLLHIVGNMGNKREVGLYLNQDVNLYASELTKEGAKVEFMVEAGRQAYVNNFEGRVKVNDSLTLEERDSLEVVGPMKLEFQYEGSNAHFIIIEMAKAR